LVWQDLPSRAPDTSTLEGWDQWLKEQERNVRARRNSPSIIQWITFSEGWGQVADNNNNQGPNTITSTTVEMVRRLDNSTRLILTDASGGRDLFVLMQSQQLLEGWLFWKHHRCSCLRPTGWTTCFDSDFLTDTKLWCRASIYGGILLVPLQHEWFELTDMARQ
jgi:hypothetical protein